ncbi:MAG: lipopolysaccharide kinase InaA family protein [Actinomycetota bacterium]|nr:lipopolysaccharide kinase InaA family protein [Actinomycetota bacterium]
MAEGAVWFEKSAETPADDARLRHEGWVLGLAAHPGVVTLAGRMASPVGRTVVRTRAVTGRPLATMDEVKASEVAGLGTVVATTVADLHDAGVTHGRLSADHILVDTAGRPVLCGFSGATAAPCSPEPGVTADVLALARTLAGLLGAGDQSEVLAHVLEGVGSGRHRPSARRLAERLGDRRFGARLPSRAHPSYCGDPARYARW